jgi:serine protease Do
MFRRSVFFSIVFFLCAAGGFTQTSLLREYVGLINQTFHPDIVAYMNKFKADFEKQGDTGAAKGIDNYLKGGSGSGFVYVAEDGANYIITNHHVITQSYTLSVTFEKQDGTKTRYEGLSIMAADEDMDIAILAFAPGERPFREGLAFLERPLEEGEDVYSAGFPGMGITTIWQFGRGMVSNASVRFPADDEGETMMGPYVQHTAQVDPGNSGGPLLVQAPGLLSGYAIAGINTLSARFRQAANFSIPMDRVQFFIDKAFAEDPLDERPRLDERAASFLKDLEGKGSVYERIAKYLSNACIAENSEYAVNEVMRRSPQAVRAHILEAFDYSPINGMAYAVGWTIERSLRSKSGKIEADIDTVHPEDDGSYALRFTANGNGIDSVWINEYGIWRIRSFGDFAAGDRSFLSNAERQREDENRLMPGNLLYLGAGYANILGRGSAFGADIKLRLPYFGAGLRFYANPTFFQIEGISGFYIPINLKYIALTPYSDFGIGLMYKTYRNDAYKNSDADKKADFGVSFQFGLQCTSVWIPGLYLQAAYQANIYIANFGDDGTRKDPHIFFIGLGYSFSGKN